MGQEQNYCDKQLIQNRNKEKSKKKTTKSLICSYKNKLLESFGRAMHYSNLTWKLTLSYVSLLNDLEKGLHGLLFNLQITLSHFE